jgi:hypothetical protein
LSGELRVAPEARDVKELADLLRTAADDASSATEGRPLAAGIAALDWPSEPHVVLWHAQTLLREFRGDCHNIALAHAGLSGIEALVVHAGLEGFPADMLRRSRRWDAQAWDGACSRLRSDGWITDSPEISLTDEGRQRRTEIEDATDRLCAPAYRAVGRDGLERIVELGTPVGAAVFHVGVAKVRPSDMNIGD